MNCYEAIDVMGDALEGRLQAVHRADFEEHLAECRPCGIYFDQLRATRVALQRWPREGPSSPHREELIDEFRRALGSSSGDDTSPRE